VFEVISTMATLTWEERYVVEAAVLVVHAAAVVCCCSAEPF
jgi:hypothetical protein